MEVYHVDEEDNRRSTSFDALNTTMMTDVGDRRGIWEQNLLQEMNDPSMFCTDRFPQIPDFPCMSSSSSSSSNPSPAKRILSATTASTASSMSSSTIDCIDVMESYGYMDLIDGNDIWDPSSLFEHNPLELLPENHEVVERSEINDDGGDDGGGEWLDELGAVFFEWLKSNKEFISAEDMRNIKIKKSTVECASKRLGSSKEGKKQLLKLILEWVQHQLQRKNSSGGELHTSGGTTAAIHPPPPPPPPTAKVSIPPSINYGFSSPPWIPLHQPYMTNQVNNGMMVAPWAVPTSPLSYMSGDYDSSFNSHLNQYNYTGSDDYQVLESVAPPWNTTKVFPFNNQFPNMGNNYAPQIVPQACGYPNQFSYNYPPVVRTDSGGGERRLIGLGPSATKEARQKRMARQRRTYFHYHHPKQNKNNHHNHVANSEYYPHAMLVDDNCSSKSHGGNWLYWPSPLSIATVPPPPLEAPHQPSDQLQSDQLHTEKNLKFLLQKVLKQSDVGSLGRIVMPKKEAESHLPDLNSRDGITIAMEDIGTSQVWNMRYRFWPNNKSRMYLLENTGDFVKANGLQEGDFIVLYSNVKCGKYLIRGVKVRQPARGKSEDKKPVKRSYRGTS